MLLRNNADKMFVPAQDVITVKRKAVAPAPQDKPSTVVPSSSTTDDPGKDTTPPSSVEPSTPPARVAEEHQARDPHPVSVVSMGLRLLFPYFYIN